MKKMYRKPMAKLVDFEYDTQVKAESFEIECDQGWTKKTSKKDIASGECIKCITDEIWFNTTSPWALIGL